MRVFVSVSLCVFVCVCLCVCVVSVYVCVCVSVRPVSFYKEEVMLRDQGLTQDHAARSQRVGSHIWTS